MGDGEDKKMKMLCLHGFRTSGSFLKKQISKWDPSIFANFVLEFPNGLFPAGGKSEIEGFFPPPYYEWFQSNKLLEYQNFIFLSNERRALQMRNQSEKQGVVGKQKEFTEHTNLEECISYLCEYITTNGPFDGLLGFSQGATLSGLLLGYQTQGKVLKNHPPFKFFVSISGTKFRIPSICEVAYKEPIKAKSVHFIGEKDWLKQPSEDLATAFQNPLIIRHPQGHTVPKLDKAGTEQLLKWAKEVLVQARGDLRKEEAQMEQEKAEEACEAAKDERNLTEKVDTREVEAIQT